MKCPSCRHKLIILFFCLSCLEWPRHCHVYSSMFVCVAFLQVSYLHPCSGEERKGRLNDEKHCSRECDLRHNKISDRASYETIIATQRIWSNPLYMVNIPHRRSYTKLSVLWMSPGVASTIQPVWHALSWTGRFSHLKLHVKQRINKLTFVWKFTRILQHSVN